MTWNNRIIRHKGEIKDWYAVHEVYYNDDGSPALITEEPIDITGETVKELVSSLIFMLRDVCKYRHNILNFEDFDNEEKYRNTDYGKYEEE
jgi:hypothetical protein